MKAKGAIGVVGGVGPYAGLDLVKKVFDQTDADRDQQHLPLMLFSFPGEIADRPTFLLGRSPENPGEALGRIMARLAGAGATVIGMPCNTAHSPAILEPALRILAGCGAPARFIHMIDSVTAFVKSTPLTRIGVVSTKATLETGLYQNSLKAAGLTAVQLDAEGSDIVQDAISNTSYGVKAQSNPVTARARAALAAQAERLVREQGAQAIILGCTEIPLALPEATLAGVPLIDATLILARELIRAFAPEKLAPRLTACHVSDRGIMSNVDI